MKIGIIGLGRMGLGISTRLQKAGHQVFGFDADHQIRTRATEQHIIATNSVHELAEQVRIFWLFLPAGPIIDTVIAQLQPALRAGDIIIDGGNSWYQDSMRRAQQLQEQQIYFLDCGTSGGVHGAQLGYCLMVGGAQEIYTKMQPAFNAVATVDGCAYVGPSGAGHYVKMVHNGIEYALLQAYAQGFQLLKEGSFKKDNLDLAVIANLWNHGSIIRSWILELIQQIYEQDFTDFDLKSVGGQIAESGTGKWTVEEADLHHIPVSLIKEALDIRFASQQNGGNYATKLVALLRNKFGGHTFVKNEDEKNI